MPYQLRTTHSVSIIHSQYYMHLIMPFRHITTDFSKRHANISTIVRLSSYSKKKIKKHTILSLSVYS